MILKTKFAKFISIMLVAAMVLSMVVLPVSAESKFSDVKAGAWYESAVGFVSDKGYMVGVSDTTFAPDADVTRAMFVTVLSRVVEAKADATKARASSTPTPASAVRMPAPSWPVRSRSSPSV